MARKKWDQAPKGWESLSVQAIDIGDIVGSPKVTVRESVSRASGAFATRTRQLGPAGAVQVFAGRDLMLASAPSGVALKQAPTVAAEVLPPPATEGSATLKEIHQLVSASGTHVVMQQQLRGHDVVGGRVVLHLDADGAYAMTGQPIGDLGERRLGTRPRANDARVRAAIRKRFSVVPKARLDIRLVVLPTDGECRWAWFAKVPVADPSADIRIFLDPASLDVLLAYPASVAAYYGEATLFPVNPLRTPKLIPVALRGLDEKPGDLLSGAQVNVVGPNGRWSAANRDFTIKPTDDRFDEAAAYYFVSEALRYYGGLARAGLFDQPMFQPLHVLVHDPASPNNSYFHPDRQNVTFGDFLAVADGGSSARSFDMVLHEVGHAISYAICRLSDSPSQETRGLNEGYSDFFACSYLDSPVFGDYVTQIKKGGRNCAQSGLKAAGSLSHYEEHDLGQIWANVLWAIRGQLGPSVTDALVMESLYFAQSVRTVEGGVGALRMADAALFPSGTAGKGRHTDMINAEYSARF
jgi:hypothetical protein